MNYKYILAALLIALTSVYGYAQKKVAKKTVAKTEKVVSAGPTQEEINFDNLLPSTAKVMFVDSVIGNKDKFMSMISLSRSAGNMAIEKVGEDAVYTYTNSLKNNRIISQLDAEKHYKLYHQTKKGTKWSTPEPIDIPGGFTDIISPYLLSDGTTLYFAAKGGEDNLGGYDIFFTVYDTDDEKYITPQSLGLPYNSSSDDLAYVVDEDNNIGYLVSSRRQGNDKTCIYSFIPTETRETYDDLDESKLKSYAEISSIKSTQTDKKQLSDAKQRLAKLRSTASISKVSTAFPICKGKTCYSRDDFKVEANKAKFDKYINQKQELSEKEIRLNALRKGYHNGQTYTKDEILQLEKTVESDRIVLESLATEIRNAELGNK